VEIRHVRAERRLPWDWTVGAAWRARRMMRDLRADVYIAHQPIVSWAATRDGRVPLVYCFHSSAADEYKSRHSSRLLRWIVSTLLGLIEAKAIARASEVLVLSEFSRGELLRHHGRNVGRVRWIPGGVDTQVFRPVENASSLRQEFTLPGEGPLLITVRNLVPRMGLEVLLRAMPEVLSSMPEVTLAIGCQGSLRNALEQLAETLGVASRVRFLGYVAEERLPGLLSAADLFVLPTVLMEGFGLVTVEALACGTPVVGTSVGATPEILAPLDEGLLVPDAKPSTLSKKIIERLRAADKDREHAARFRRACRDYAKKYDWECAIDALESSLAEVEVRPCPFCAEHSARRVLRLEENTVWACESCGALRRAPQLSPEKAERFYQCQYGPLFLPEADVAARKAMFGHLLARLGRPEGRSLLDLGAGSGLFVRMAAEAGWQAEGTELSIQSRDWARKHHGVTLRDPVASPPPDAAYDVVSIINVLNQAADPLKLLRAARKALRPDGLLLVRVPNASFHIPWIRLTSLPGLRRLARLGVLHSYAFTPQSLRYLLRAEGYRVLSLRNARPAGASRSLVGPILVKAAGWFARAPLLWAPSLEAEAKPGDLGPGRVAAG
jgi:glycosyltransferase involved in cell wall biosynthesis/SAM-dependent methyltransferase